MSSGRVVKQDDLGFGQVRFILIMAIPGTSTVTMAMLTTITKVILVLFATAEGRIAAIFAKFSKYCISTLVGSVKNFIYERKIKKREDR